MQFTIGSPFGLKSICVTGGDTTLVEIEVHVFDGSVIEWGFSLDCAYDTVCKGLNEMARGALIQDALPMLNAEARELFITPPTWYKPDDNEN